MFFKKPFIISFFPLHFIQPEDKLTIFVSAVNGHPDATSKTNKNDIEEDEISKEQTSKKVKKSYCGYRYISILFPLQMIIHWRAAREFACLVEKDSELSSKVFVMPQKHSIHQVMCSGRY